MRDYNFFSAFDKKKGLYINPKSPYFIALIIVIVAVLASAGLVVRNILLEAQIQELRDQITVVKESQDYVNAIKLKDELDALSQYELSADVVLADFESNDVLGTELLDQLAAMVPTTAVLLSISIDNANLDAIYSVPDKRVAAELIFQMEDSGLFYSVHAPSISQSVGQVGYVVSIQCSMKVGETQ